MLTDNPTTPSRNNLPLMPYQVSQAQEVLGEYVWQIHGFVTRNYVYDEKPIPSEVAGLVREALDIRSGFKTNDSRETLNAYETRLKEINKLVREATPQPHK